MQYEGQNLFNKYLKKKNKQNQKTTGQQMTLKKIAFCKHQNFFFSVTYLTSIWFVRFTCVDDRKINRHSTCKFARKWITYYLSSSS